MIVLGGIDIGGTKCAAVLGSVDEQAEEPKVTVLGKRRFPTPSVPAEALDMFIQALKDLLTENGSPLLAAIGISCGGPLDSARGLVLSPPNLPGWDRIDVISPFREAFDVPTALQNDANACALAEWRWGAGRGCQNMIFLTFGTGMGAGLILDGRLYSGSNDMAGEVGHIRLEQTGPVGYGKAGSFEGFCSGGGIAQIARQLAEQRLQEGQPASFCSGSEELADITAEKVAEAARQGDPTAVQIFDMVGNHLGRGLAVLVDLLNPERIVIGSIYARQQSLLEPVVLQVLHEEALPLSLSVCEIIPAGLGESVGDLAALSVAYQEFLRGCLNRR